MVRIKWYVNGQPEQLVADATVTAGQYLGHFWIENISDRTLEYVMIKDKRGRVLFSTVRNGERDYILCLGTIKPGGRGSCHAWVNKMVLEGPIQIIAEEMVEQVA